MEFTRESEEADDIIRWLMMMTDDDGFSMMVLSPKITIQVKLNIFHFLFAKEHGNVKR